MALSYRLRTLTSGALDFLFPPQCAGCGAPGQDFCDRCAQAVEPLPASICSRCGRPQAPGVSLCPTCRASHFSVTLSRAAALHKAPLREAIHALKYEGRPALARPLGRYLVAAFHRKPWSDIANGIDAIVPAPLHADRLRERGFNQSQLLAEVLSEASGIALHPEWIERVRATRQQVGLNATERKENVSGAFTASASMTGRSVLLVDDVFTTGATLQACADAAVDAGARKVYALALAIPAHR